MIQCHLCVWLRKADTSWTSLRVHVSVCQQQKRRHQSWKPCGFFFLSLFQGAALLQVKGKKIINTFGSEKNTTEKKKRNKANPAAPSNQLLFLLLFFPLYRHPALTRVRKPRGCWRVTSPLLSVVSPHTPLAYSLFEMARRLDFSIVGDSFWFYFVLFCFVCVCV